MSKMQTKLLSSVLLDFCELLNSSTQANSCSYLEKPPFLEGNKGTVVERRKERVVENEKRQVNLPFD